MYTNERKQIFPTKIFLFTTWKQVQIRESCSVSRPQTHVNLKKGADFLKNTSFPRKYGSVNWIFNLKNTGSAFLRFHLGLATYA